MNSSALQSLVDQAKCSDLLARYGRAVDRLDERALEGQFWPDAVVDLGVLRGNGREIAGLLVANSRRSLRRSHVTSNSVFDFHEDRVDVDSCSMTHAISVDDSGGMTRHEFVGRYLDRIERRGDQWRFAARHYQLHSYITGPYVEDPALTAMAETAMDHHLSDGESE